MSPGVRAAAADLGGSAASGAASGAVNVIIVTGHGECRADSGAQEGRPCPNAATFPSGLQAWAHQRRALTRWVTVCRHC